MYDDEEIDFTKLKYVLYARKSTEDEARQVRSIGDQIDDCRVLEQRLGIRIVKVLEEKKSAKKPGQRPVFSQMLRELKKGEYQGIVAWHPDRLARNMREGGEIIDMIDEEQIIDLKFVTHHFTNDATGKMLLGMAFVLSKQYSDDLSQKVTRGIRGNFKEGKSSGTPKHGYLRNDQGEYEPDAKNYNLICEAWHMRLNTDKSLAVIAEEINAKGYGRAYKKGAKRYGQTIQLVANTLSDIFRDSIYYGVLLQAGRTVDLREQYDFKPAVTEEEWNAVQQLSQRRVPYVLKKRTIFYPLRGMITCHYCHKKMVTGASKGRGGTRYLNYRCDTKDCPRQAKNMKRSCRGNIVFNFIYDLLNNGLNFTEERYDEYRDSALLQNEKGRQKLQTQLHSMQGAMKSAEAKAKETALSLANETKDSPSRKYINERVTNLEYQAAELAKEIGELKTKLDHPEQDVLSIKQFLNLSKDASAKLKAGDVIAKDVIVREIFLNIELGDQKVASYRLKDHYATLLKTRKQVLGRGERT